MSMPVPWAPGFSPAADITGLICQCCARCGARFFSITPVHEASAVHFVIDITFRLQTRHRLSSLIRSQQLYQPSGSQLQLYDQVRFPEDVYFVHNLFQKHSDLIRRSLSLLLLAALQLHQIFTSATPTLIFCIRQIWFPHDATSGYLRDAPRSAFRAASAVCNLIFRKYIMNND